MGLLALLLVKDNGDERRVKHPAPCFQFPTLPAQHDAHLRRPCGDAHEGRQTLRSVRPLQQARRALRQQQRPECGQVLLQQGRNKKRVLMRIDRGREGFVLKRRCQAVMAPLQQARRAFRQRQRLEAAGYSCGERSEKEIRLSTKWHAEKDQG